jgi:predicted GIY-YIG superfamily endonuclease
MWYVYLLRCSDGTIYTGCTSNLEERLKRHRSKQVSYTKTRLPVEVETYIAFSDKYKAYIFST